MYEYIKENKYPYYPSGDMGVDAISEELTRRGIPNTVENTGGHIMVGHIYSAKAPLVICFDDMSASMYDITTDNGWSDPIAGNDFYFVEGVGIDGGWGDEIDPIRLKSFVDTLVTMVPLLDVTPPPRIATNGETVTLNESGEWLDSLGRSGYYPHFGGGWVCYTCGHLCECGESDE